MNTTKKISELRIIITKGNKCAQFGKPVGDALGFVQVGTFRSEYENKYFSDTAEFVSTLEKYLTNPSARIERLVINGQTMTFKSNATEQAIAVTAARFAATLAVNEVN